MKWMGITHKGIPLDEYKSKSWRVMADYDCGLWDDRGYGTDISDDEINVPDEYMKNFNAWLYKYWAIKEGSLDLDSFNKEGRALAVELKKIVGPNVKVTYTYEKPADSKYALSDEEEIP